MKIGILTFHRAHNYGAVLQAYALQEFLKSVGHKVEVIDYQPNYLLQPFRVFRPGLSFLEKVAQLPVAAVRSVRRFRFNRFIEKKLAISNAVHEKNGIRQDYDAYVLGSDQIWNPEITKGDPVFFGGFDRPAHSRLISYAASTEATHEGAAVDFSAQHHHLRRFSSISVREDIVREQLQPFVEGKVDTVLDPALLVDPSAFDGFSQGSASSGHVVVYQVHVYENVIPIAKAIQRQKGIERRVKLIPRVSRDELLNVHAACSPEEFVGLIKSADYVVTTSFHGAVFAIIFEKQFVCVMNPGKGNYRISSLLKSLGLEGRMIYSENDIPTDFINYREVSVRLNKLRAASSAFLLNALAPRT